METIEFLHLFSEYYLQVNKVKSLCSRNQKFFFLSLKEISYFAAHTL